MLILERRSRAPKYGDWRIQICPIGDERMNIDELTIQDRHERIQSDRVRSGNKAQHTLAFCRQVKAGPLQSRYNNLWFTRLEPFFIATHHAFKRDFVTHPRRILVTLATR
jgi:hypothetical protein